MLRFLPLAEVDPECLASFVDAAVDAWLDHHPACRDLINDPSPSFAVVDGDRIRGVCVFGIGRYGFARILAGPGFAFGEKPDRALLKACGSALRDMAAEHRATAVHWTRPPEAAPALFDAGFDEIMDAFGFREGYPWGGDALPSPARSVIVDLQRPASELVSNMFKGHRASLSRARRERDVSVNIVTGPNATKDLDLALAIVASSHERTRGGGIAARTASCLESLLADRRVLVAILKRNGEGVAAAVLLAYKDACRYFAGGSLASALPWGANVLLQVEAMLELQRNGYARYNVGPTFPALAAGKIKAIGDFKRHFGGRLQPLRSGFLLIEPKRFFWSGAVASDIMHSTLAVRTALRRWRKK